MKYRNDYRKNIVFCGFNQVERDSMLLYDAPGPAYDYGDEGPYRKCPVYTYVDKFEDALKHRGLVLFLKVDDNFDPLEFDKKYRKKLDYWYIYYYNENYKTNFRYSKYSNMYQMDDSWLYADWYDGFVTEIDDYFKEHPKLKLHEKKKQKLDSIHDYIKKKREISTNELSNEFKISIRNVQRYMNDINLLYNDIGYDYSKNLWYICR